MTDSEPSRPPSPSDQRLAAVIGFHLALLQFVHVFVLEARLTGRAAVYFTAVLFWLLGFLVGLGAPPGRIRLVPWTAVATAAYYLSWGLLGSWPYQVALLPIIGPCVAISGSLGGAYFALLSDQGGSIRLLASENHAFLAGIVVSAVAASFVGQFLLNWGPLLTTVAVWTVHGWQVVSDRKRSAAER
jgi:hypothetical protein